MILGWALSQPVIAAVRVQRQPGRLLVACPYCEQLHGHGDHTSDGEDPGPCVGRYKHCKQAPYNPKDPTPQDYRAGTDALARAGLITTCYWLIVVPGVATATVGRWHEIKRIKSYDWDGIAAMAGEIKAEIARIEREFTIDPFRDYYGGRSSDQLSASPKSDDR